MLQFFFSYNTAAKRTDFWINGYSNFTKKWHHDSNKIKEDNRVLRQTPNTELILKSKPTLLLRIFSRSVWGCVCVCMHVGVCVYACACMCACMYVHACVWVCACVHMCVRLCMCMCVCVHVRACMHVHACACVYVYACARGRVCVCVCVCVCVNAAPTGSVLPTVFSIVITQIRRHKQQNGGLHPFPSLRDGWRPGQKWGNNIKEVGKENKVRVVVQGRDKPWTPVNNMLYYLETAKHNNWAL